MISVLRSLLIIAILAATTATLRAQETTDSPDSVQTTLKMNTQYGLGVIASISPEGYGSEIRLGLPIETLPGLRVLATASLLGIPDSSTPIAFQAILAFDLSWHILSFDNRSAGIYVKAGPALEAMINTQTDEMESGPAFDIGAGIQVKVARRGSLYLDAQYVAGIVDRAELRFGYLYGK